MRKLANIIIFTSFLLISFNTYAELPKVFEFALPDIDTAKIKPGIDFLNALPDSLKTKLSNLRKRINFDVNHINENLKDIELKEIRNLPKHSCKYVLHNKKDNITLDTCIDWISKWQSESNNYVLAYDKKVFHNGKFIHWDYLEHGTTYPCIIEDKLLIVEKIKNLGRYCNDGVRYGIKKGDKILYEYNVVECVDYQTKAFFVLDGRWYLQVGNNLIVDGKNFNKENNFTEVFNCRYVKNFLFYIAKKDETYRIYCEGKALKNEYDFIVHDMCCEPAVMNVVNRHNIVCFFAIKKGIWNLVVIDFKSESP